jgi:hypothetical protein
MYGIITVNPNAEAAITPHDNKRLHAGLQPREFLIVLKKKSNELLFQLPAICHELVHLRQFLTGLGKFVIKNNKLDILYFNQDLNHLPYDKQPWEVEAHAEMYPLASVIIDELARKQRKAA